MKHTFTVKQYIDAYLTKTIYIGINTCEEADRTHTF